MADNTTELEVLNQIVDVLGGTSGQYETVVPTLQQILALLGGGGGGSGYNPSLSVGRADTLTGADSTAQWAQRESTGSGAATVRSVQGAAEVQNDELVPVRIAGIRSMTAQGGELGSVEWPTQTLRAAGSVADMLYSDHVDVRVGVVDLGTKTWIVYQDETHTFRMSAPELLPKANGLNNIICAEYANGSGGATLTNMQVCGAAASANIYIRNDSCSTAAEIKAALNGVFLYYELANPTTQPISPSLPMTYKVQQGGSESIIVPDGEISATPIITVAEGESAATLVMDALACIATPDGPVATSSHAVNTYLTMQGKLYKVTSAIAVGETIKSGTNVSETTVMAELIARTA